MNFIIVIVLVAFAVFLLSFNIIFRKGGKFPDTEIGHNKKLREMGVMCARMEELQLWARPKKPTKLVIDPKKIKYAPEKNMQA